MIKEQVTNPGREEKRLEKTSINDLLLLVRYILASYVLIWLIATPFILLILSLYRIPFITEVDVGEGAGVLEIGPGSGTFTFEAARHASIEGCVIAVDIQPSMWETL